MKDQDRNIIFAARPRKSMLYSSLLLAGAIVGGNAQAAVTLPTGSILMFQAGVPTNVNNVANVSSGSYFGMDQDNNSKITGGEKTAIAPFYGVPIGIVTTATNSHSGAPNGSENPGIDEPWDFFANTGMHFLTVPATVLGGTAPNFTLGLSGWNVTWNGIPSIDMGTGAWTPLNCTAIGCGGQTFSNGVANLAWDGISGDAFTLTYAATVPLNSPNFPGVKYYLYLTGNVIVPQPIVSDTGAVSAGITGVAGGRLTDSDLTAHNIPLDPDPAFQHPLRLYFDFTVPAGTGTAHVVIPLASPLPASAVYRKYNPLTATWDNFNTTAGNAVLSAPGTPGTCPAPGNAAYTAGLTQGDYCIELTIVNGGPDDGDTSGTTISDPGGIATGTVAAIPDTRTSSTSGCSISPRPIDPFKRSDWWLLMGFVAWLGWYRRKRQH